MTDAQAPREDLVRMESGRLHYRSDNSDNGEEGVLYGYAAVFNEWTEIDSWEGRFKERLAPGAFRKTLRERGDQIRVLFNHGMDPSIGDKPLGKPRVMREDEKGLYVEVPLDDTSYNRDIKALLKSGALDGMSFRMSVADEQWDFPEKGDPERTIRQIKLYEFGPVTFPAYAATQAGVRAHAPRAYDAWRTAQGIETTVIPKRDDSTPEPAEVPGESTETPEEPAPPVTEPADATPDARADEAAPTERHADPDEPSTEGHSSTPRPRMSRERRAMTLDYIESRLQRARETADLHASRVEEFERLTQQER